MKQNYPQIRERTIQYNRQHKYQLKFNPLNKSKVFKVLNIVKRVPIKKPAGPKYKFSQRIFPVVLVLV